MKTGRIIIAALALSICSISQSVAQSGARWSGVAQPGEGWKGVVCQGVCAFLLPPTMEILDEYIRQEPTDKTNVYELKPSDSTLMRAQSIDPDAHAEIILKVNEATSEVILFNVFLSMLSPEDYNETISEIDSDFKKSIEEELASLGLKLLEWDDTRIVSINKYRGVRLSYICQFGTGPKVRMQTYTFFVNGREIILTLLYRVKYAETYQKDFDKVARDFRIF